MVPLYDLYLAQERIGINIIFLCFPPLIKWHELEYIAKAGGY